MQLKPTDGSDDTWIMLIFSVSVCAHSHSFQAAQSEKHPVWRRNAGLTVSGKGFHKINQIWSIQKNRKYRSKHGSSHGTRWNFIGSS